MRRQKIMFFLILIGICHYFFADSWLFFPGKTEFKFGNIKIIQIIDAKEPTSNPDFILDFYKGNKLQAKYRNIYVEAIFKSPDNYYFVGLSNSGIPGTAYVVFDKKGNLLREVKHDCLDFVEYTNYSLIITRKWIDCDNPQIKFIKGDFDTIIQVSGLKGKKYNLLNKGIWGGKSFLYSKKDSLDNMYNNTIIED